MTDKSSKSHPKRKAKGQRTHERRVKQEARKEANAQSGQNNPLPAPGRP